MRKPTTDPTTREPSPSAATILDAWERGRSLAPAPRALAVLEAALPDLSPAELGAQSAGRRDALMLRLRERLLGPRLDATAECPACGERAEFDLDARAFRPGPNPEPDATVEAGGFRVAWRLPTASDLAALDPGSTVERSRKALLEATVLEVTAGGEAASARDLPEEVVAALGRAMERADPLADVRIDLTCPGCGLGWQAPFDVTAFVWEELDGLARRLLGDVHRLAAAYGWSEDAILGLSPARRAIYLERIAG